jgi:hypothetical protein
VSLKNTFLIERRARNLTGAEIDALCQVAYELLRKLGRAMDCCSQTGEPSGS